MVGSGSHDELLKDNKYYKKLYESELSSKKWGNDYLWNI
jgi:ABC-type multidrug transport system fused ATPase/permease subunit